LEFYRDLKLYKDKIRENIFLQNIAVVASGNVAAKLIGILSAPILTRIYSPEDFGVYSVFVSIIVIIGTFATLRYAVTIPLAESEGLADDVIKLCFLVSVLFSLLLAVFTAFLGSYIAIAFSADEIIPYLWFIPLAVFGKGLYETLNNWAVRSKQFKLITKTKVNQGISSSVIKMGLGAVGFTPSGLIVGQIFQEAAGIGSLFSKLSKTKKDIFREFSWVQIKRAAVRFKNFPLIQSWSQLLLSVGSQLPILLIGYIFGLKVVGVFGLAQSLINMPMDLLGQSVAQVYYSEISKIGKNNPEKILRLSISLIKKLVLVGIFPVFLLMIFGPFLFEVFFGSEWRDAGVYSQFLSVLILTRFISAPIMNCLNVLEIQAIQLWLNSLRIVVTLMVFCLAMYLDMTPKSTLLLYSISVSIFYIYVVVKILKILKHWKSK